MGKTTTARLFSEAGIPVWDADAAVHHLYEASQPGAKAIESLVPQAIGVGGVDRALLKSALAHDPTLLARIEDVIHPLVAADRTAFVRRHWDDALVLLDIPLLFETGAEKDLDAIVVVTAPADVQRRRVLQRSGMDGDMLASILSRQMPDEEKRRRADFVIQTGEGVDRAREAVQSVIRDIQERHHA